MSGIDDVSDDLSISLSVDDVSVDSVSVEDLARLAEQFAAESAWLTVVLLCRRPTLSSSSVSSF
jgi:hypothetical protein